MLPTVSGYLEPILVLAIPFLLLGTIIFVSTRLAGRFEARRPTTRGPFGPFLLWFLAVSGVLFLVMLAVMASQPGVGFGGASKVLVVVLVFVAVALLYLLGMNRFQETIRDRREGGHPERLRSLADRLGLVSDPRALQEVSESSLPLLSRGRKQRIENPMRVAKDPSTVLFEFTNDEVGDFTLSPSELAAIERHEPSSWNRVSCALTKVPADFPNMTIAPRHAALVGKASSDPPLEVHFESDAFNRLFLVLSDDPRATSAVIDARMIQWLMNRSGEWLFEVGGDSILVAMPRHDRRRIRSLLSVSREFRARIPDVAFSLYPPSHREGSNT